MVLIKQTKKMIIAVGIVITSLLQMSCVTNSEGATGGALGGIVGALAGAAACASGGKSVDDCENEIIMGAAVGAAAGYMAGARLEARRLEGQSDLQFVQANNADMQQRNAALKRRNIKTRQLIDEAKKEAEQIKESVASSSEKQEKFKAVAAKLEADQQAAKETKADAKLELKEQELMLVSVKNGDFPASEADTLEKEIASLRSQIDVLEEGELELASISSTTF